ncbi:interleukin-22 receptor subunit alpha-1 isoform X1 [Melanerpes formicivorus]|uniref:interleukin-22 receptor subunit alpha-1 isoform X1 n=1 Tax=Melanerpes formicivorus TaxID=211600 RepID=UPI00358ED2D0
MKQLLVVLAVLSLAGTVTTERSSCLKQARFASTNLENILTWETEADIPPGTLFDVQYKQYGDKTWLSKQECQGITQPFCNLTRETENFTEPYYGRVRATGHSLCSPGWLRSERFEPRKETTIGAPGVSFVPSVRSIKFLIQPPYTPLRDEGGHQLTVEDIYSKFGPVDYHLTIFNQRTQQKWTKSEHNKEFEVSNLEPDTEYNGTVYLCLFQKRSKPQVFWVRTQADNTWLLYCFVALAFCAGLVFAAISYVIYKYIKQHGAQPTALDFRGIPSFQPLTLTVEHIIKPISLSKSSLLFPEVQAPQISHRLDRALAPAPWSFPPPETAYQQQVAVPVLQPPCLASTEPSCYAPQISHQSVPAATSSKNLSLTYGMCIGSTEQLDRKSSKPTQGLKEVSPGGNLTTQGLDKSCSHWDYKGQGPNWALWHSSDTRGSVCWQGQQLALQTEGVGSNEPAAQLPLALLEQGGCYRQQPGSSVTADTDYLREESLSALLSSVSTRNHFPGRDSTEQWLLPHPHPTTKLQLPETPEQLKAREELSCTELSNAVSPDAVSAGDSDTVLAMFFKDLNLQVVWD